MNLQTPLQTAVRTTVFTALLALGVLTAPVPAAAARPAATLPATPVGEFAAELVRRINTDTPAQIRQWVPGVFSAAFPPADKADFIANLVSAARDSGGVDLFDARTDPRHPGVVQMVVKARRSGQLGQLFLVADPDHPGQLIQAGIAAMDDPAIYAGWPDTVVSHAELARLIHATLDRLVRASDFSGCVTVADHGKTVFDECRGLADRGFAVPVDPQTRFHIASMNKMFTAVAIAQLVEAGKLSWDARLDALVPEYPDHEAAKNITVWQLLHHTAGLGDYMVAEYFAQRETFIDPVDYLDLIGRQPKVGKPGGDWSYSNAGYVLLGRIIENVSQERYEDYIQRHVFAPAGMTASGLDRLDEVTPKLAVGYFRDGIFASHWKPAWAKLGIKGSPAGGGYSNNTDLLRFAQALRNGKLLKPTTLNKMFDDQVPAGPGGYAAGFGDRLSHGSPIRGHSGGIEGTTANLQLVWNANAVVALTSNQGPTQTWMLVEHIADLLAAGSEQTEAGKTSDTPNQGAAN